MTRGKYSFKSQVGEIDIHLCDVDKWLKDRKVLGSDGREFFFDMIDSAEVDWDMELETKEYGVKSFIVNVKNVKVAIRDIDDQLLDINFNCDEYDIEDYIETNTHCFFPRTLWINFAEKRVEVYF